MIEQKIISLIKMEPPRVEGEEDAAPARISWSDQFHLFVAMGDRVRVCEIKTRSAAELASPRGRDLPQHMVEITASFQVGKGQLSQVTLLIYLIFDKAIYSLVRIAWYSRNVC